MKLNKLNSTIGKGGKCNTFEFTSPSRSISFSQALDIANPTAYGNSFNEIDSSYDFELCGYVRSRL